MSTSRATGAFVCFLGFLGVCALALALPASNGNVPYFGSLSHMQSEIANEVGALKVLETQAPGSTVTVSGRAVTIDLPDVVSADYREADMKAAIRNQVDGVRSVEINGTPVVAGQPGPAELPADEPAADPTPAEPEVDDPTAVPEPEPTEAEPEPEPVDEPELPSLDEVVAGIDLSAVEFELGTSVLTNDDTRTLDAVAAQLQGYQGALEVQAHTNNIGDPDVNLVLSQDRASAVSDYLSAQGVELTLTSQGFGGGMPIADNSTEQGRASNERVAFVVEGN